MKYNVFILKNVIQGQYNEFFQTKIYYEHFSLISTNNKNHYLHFYNFQDNWEKVNKVLQNILNEINFSPENKPKIWIPIVDIKSLKPNFYAKKWWISY